jgi:hypothetical protein
MENIWKIYGNIYGKYMGNIWEIWEIWEHAA